MKLIFMQNNLHLKVKKKTLILGKKPIVKIKKHRNKNNKCFNRWLNNKKKIKKI